jgi:hypothetical protein
VRLKDLNSGFGFEDSALGVPDDSDAICRSYLGGSYRGSYLFLEKVRREHASTRSAENVSGERERRAESREQRAERERRPRAKSREQQQQSGREQKRAEIYL